MYWLIESTKADRKLNNETAKRNKSQKSKSFKKGRKRKRNSKDKKTKKKATEKKVAAPNERTADYVINLFTRLDENRILFQVICGFHLFNLVPNS